MGLNDQLQVDIQYLLFLYSEKQQTLISDRRKNDNAILYISFDEANKLIFFDVKGLRVEGQRKKTPKIHTDIYILIENAKSIVEFLESVKDEISKTAVLDRQIRDAKDPTANYDNSRVPLQINERSGYFKITKMEAELSDLKEKVIWEREKGSNIEPCFNVDLQHRNTRLHLGSSAVWDNVIEQYDCKRNRLLIEIPFSEFGHLLTSIKSSLKV